MKRLFLVMTVFCLSLVSLKAEAINDNDFETFFAQFQKEIKDGNLWRFKELIYEDYKFADPEGCNSYFDQSVSGFIDFYEEFRKDYKSVLKLNRKNNYKAGKSLKDNRKDYWEIRKLDSDIAEKIGVKYGYELMHYINGEDGGSSTCIFVKVSASDGDSEWRIIAVSFAG